MRIVRGFVIAAALFLCLSPRAFAQKSGDLQVPTRVLQKFHCQPRQAGDSLSDDVFRMFIDAADPYHRVFLAGDIEPLKKLSHTALEMQSTERSGFISTFSSLYSQRLKESMACMNKICETPADLFAVDTLEIAFGTLSDFPVDEDQLMKRWKIMVKRGILNLMFDETNNSDSIGHLPRASLMELEQQYRKRISVKFSRRIARILDHPAGIENYCYSLYLNSLCACYDPHTAYFSPDEMKIFKSQVTNEGYYFGFYLTEDAEGNVSISGLTPGGPAWKSNALNKGDYLIAMQWEGQEEIDLSFVSLEELTSLLAASVDKALNVKVRKADGSISVVKLLKEKSKSQENIVKSFLLTGSSKVGYIYLPGFYSNAENDGSPGCASDVAREILKLSKEGMQGLILDLRQNGGGSVREAVDLAGIFIDSGPVCVFKSRDAKPFSLKDMNMGTAYSGPLVILVNGYSASASEIVAASLQDYQRALIIGSPTYGKATGQVVVPVDSTLLPDLSNMKNASEDKGFLKITTDEVFRITGASHQKTGVNPDINIPDLTYSAQGGEGSQEFAFGNSRIDKKTFYTPWPALPVDTLQKMSSGRTRNDPFFMAVDQYNQDALQFETETKQMIGLQQFMIEYSNEEKFFARIDSLTTLRPQVFQVANNQFDIPLLQTDETFRIINTNDIERLQQDYILQETYNILNDLIYLQKK